MNVHTRNHHLSRTIGFTTTKATISLATGSLTGLNKNTILHQEQEKVLNGSTNKDQQVSINGTYNDTPVDNTNRTDTKYIGSSSPASLQPNVDLIKNWTS